MKTKYQVNGFILFFFFFGLSSVVNAQFWKKIAETAEKAVERTVLNKTDEKVSNKTSKTIDDATDVEYKKSKKSKNKAVISSGNDEYEDIDAETTFEVYSKFDFVPGERIIAFEDFSQDAIGDLPARWNSSGSAEVVTIKNAEGRYIQVTTGKGSYVPEFITEFPDNFTLEFDMVFDFDVSKYAFKRYFSVVFSDLANPAYELQNSTPGKNGFVFSVRGGIGGGGAADIRKYSQDKQLNLFSDKKMGKLTKDNRGRGKVMHISIWKQNQRMRVYIDEEKVFDIPRAFEKNVTLKNLKFFSEISPQDTFFYLGNMRYAIGEPDLRNKLISEGTLITYGITFDTGKATVKSTSYSTIKNIANILSENPAVNILITGHTDTDGDASSNQKLSEERAVAVKNIMVETFGINKSRIKTSGKGEESPVAVGNKPEAKAKNRRVEFKKL
ncbi:hypothetical protein GCM10022393_09370 [Aquimarina addita]|uniref:OmpA-like domain-containing protein n=1 Tax=Aquimarina addita TaxID=870485 RepID=A0ABP7XCG9_9FLAO